jgi:hypothetical protein
LTVNDCVFLSNSNGIYASNSIVTTFNSTFRNSVATHFGGGKNKNS